MDSLPQEIIDEIIDNLPRSCLRSSSLVARRWRKRSQQRVFSTILFRTESTVKSWYTNIQSDPGGTSSYVKFGIFARIDKWTDPALFGRVLGNFNSLTGLGIADTGIPDEVLEGVLQGELGGITALHLVGLRCSLPMMISIIVAFPNLQDLTINDLTIAPREGPSTGPLPRRPLGSLCVHGGAYGAVTEALVNHRFASRKLTLDAQPRSIQKLLILSSATIVELVLIDESLLGQPTSHLIDLPPFPALTSLKIYYYGSFSLSPHLINTMLSISLAPALTSITIVRQLWLFPEPDLSKINWSNLDRWLVQLAKNTVVEGGLVLKLTEWPRYWAPEMLLPGFREVGKFVTDLFDPYARH